MRLFGLPGAWHVRSVPGWSAPSAVCVVEQDLTARKVAGWIPVTDALLADPAVDLTTLIETGLDRVFRPWRYPDPPSIPPIDLFPRLTRARRWLNTRLGDNDR